MNFWVFHFHIAKDHFIYFYFWLIIVIIWYEKNEKWVFMFFVKVCMHTLKFRFFFQAFCKPYFCLGFSPYLCKTLWKRGSGTKNIPCEVFMNEAKTETNLMEEENLSLQTQKNVVQEDETKISKLQLEKLMNQRKEWRGHNINALCWSF